MENGKEQSSFQIFGKFGKNIFVKTVYKNSDGGDLPENNVQESVSTTQHLEGTQAENEVSNN